MQFFLQMTITESFSIFGDRQVLPSVEPGFMRKLLPEEAPEEPEDWRDVLKDMDRAIMPGVSKQSLC
jgi:hypothetical protein